MDKLHDPVSSSTCGVEDHIVNVRAFQEEKLPRGEKPNVQMLNQRSKVDDADSDRLTYIRFHSQHR